MCLILIAYKAHPRFPLVLLANRDEFYDRPTQAAHYWPAHPQLLAGRDLKAGGTWLGVTKDDRIAAVTNIRKPHHMQKHGPSRGLLVSGYLEGQLTPEEFVAALSGDLEEYSGFNLLLGAGERLLFIHSDAGKLHTIEPGIHSLSNATLDTPWPKTESGTQQLAKLLDDDQLDIEALFNILADSATAPDSELPTTGVPLEWERALSASFIQSPDYGTRSSTLILRNHAGLMSVIERTWKSGTKEYSEIREAVGIE